MKKTSAFMLAALAVIAVGAIALGSGRAMASDSGAGGVKLETRLVGSNPLASGEAEFELRPALNQSKFEVEVKGVVPGDYAVTVAHGGSATKVGILHVSALGFGEFELDSTKGQTVPALVKGDMIVVGSPTAILSGTF